MSEQQKLNSLPHRLTIAIAVALVAIVAALPTLHAPIGSFYNKKFNHRALYEPTRKAIDQALLGSQYSVMHNPEAGIAVIFDISHDTAITLQNRGTDFSHSDLSKAFYIDQYDSVYQQTDGSNWFPLPELSDTYPMTVPATSVAVVIADMNVTSRETLMSVLKGLHLTKIGADQESGTYAIYSNNQALLEYLVQQQCLSGRLQTSAGIGEHPTEVIVPIDKHQEMDIALGKNLSINSN